MSNIKPQPVKILQWIHFLLFLLITVTIILLHIYTDNFLDFLRFPEYVKAVDFFASPNWPEGFHFYHVILLSILLLTLINGFGLIFYENKVWRITTDLASFLNILFMWPISLFFLFTLASSEYLTAQNIQSSLIFFVITFIVFVLDLVTWYIDDHSLVKIHKKRRFN